MSWDYLSEEEAEELLQATYQNPMIITVKCPSVQGGMLENAKFRVSKEQVKCTKQVMMKTLPNQNGKCLLI